LFAWHDGLWTRINLRNDRQRYQDGLFRLDVPTFNEVRVREGLLNAVAHRDYRLGGAVFVRQFAQRLKVVSRRLCLNGLIGDPAFVRFMERLGEETLRGFSTNDFLVLDHLHREQPLNEVLRSRLPRLVEMGAVEPTGRGKGNPLPTFAPAVRGDGRQGRVHTQEGPGPRHQQCAAGSAHRPKQGGRRPHGGVPASAAQPVSQRNSGAGA